jgi:hypothetical protein
MANTPAPERGDYLSASARKDAARQATKAAVARELMLVSILTRFWPAYLFHPTKEQINLPYMICLETPAGPICWRVGTDELELFAHIKRRLQTGPEHYQSGDKEALLVLLSTEGWTP